MTAAVSRRGRVSLGGSGKLGLAGGGSGAWRSFRAAEGAGVLIATARAGARTGRLVFSWRPREVTRP
ncbi:hypothetical protein AB0K40_34920 [Nonomuraea bangladeshensis]|uniref:Uncharacterized protein n=1 Tax=Nonomuraea bangladeshensis TaxID=404385 RepID=A0ABV3HDX2_9ACTN